MTVTMTDARLVDISELNTFH
jgi:hypothetical protein